jgi:hypothetical protein
MVELHKDHSRLHFSRFTVDEREDFYKAVKKSPVLVEYLIKLLDTFYQQDVSMEEKNWEMKRAFADGQNHVVLTIKKLFKHTEE